MYDLKIVDGDISLNGDGSVKTVSGADRIIQELSCWLLEPIGTDRMYSAFGSILNDSIGGTVSSTTKTDVKAEVTRVVNNYVTYQRKQYQEYVNGVNGNIVNVWGAGDLIKSVVSIDVSAVADTVRVVVRLKLSDGSVVDVEQIA